MWAIVCFITWHDCTWQGWGVFAFASPTPQLGHAHMCTFCLHGTDVKGPYIGGHSRYIHVSDGRMQNQSQFQNYISKIFYFEIILNGNFLRLMFVYTTSDISLTLRFKF
jgi:hypothetical protein